jgi:hypothetical protein
MIGFGVASSLTHEGGHQVAALLDLVHSLRAALRSRRTASSARERLAWLLWDRWISEIVADFWAVGKLGIAATLGLIGVVSLPRAFVFRIDVDDPHPFPWIRVHVGTAIGETLYPHWQWRDLADLWSAYYPTTDLDDDRRRVITALRATLPELVGLLADHRPPRLQGASLREVMPTTERTPEQLITHFHAWAQQPRLIYRAQPTLAFAVLGQARAAGLLAPTVESRQLEGLLTHWALRSTLAVGQRPHGSIHRRDEITA